MPAQSDDLESLSVCEAADKIRCRKLSSSEYTRALVDRIERFDPQLHAFITPTPELALEQAREADRQIAGGNYRGPLHGIPFALKDIYDTKNILTSGGSRTFLKNIPSQDATIVGKLRDAGAVLLGKLQTHEFAHGGPSFDLPWPASRNPWNLEHFTGGSSSGAAAALAARLVPIALGSDTGGSIRGPASYCGVTGYMPTFGLVSRTGVIPNSFTFDHCGPMARTVEDCALVLQAIAGYDARDAGSIEQPIPDYRAALDEDIRGLRIGALRHYWEKDLIVHEDHRAALEEALLTFRRLGATVEDCRWRPVNEGLDIKIIIAETEIFAVHQGNLIERAGDFGRDFLGRVLPACLFQSLDYVQALREHRRYIEESRRLLDKYDVLVTCGFGPAPRLDAHRTVNFWKRSNAFTPSNTARCPALALPCGFSKSGLPLGMQIIGAAFGDAAVLKVGHAYQKATDWHTRGPVLAAGNQPPPVSTNENEPGEPDLDSGTRRLVEQLALRAGLKLNERQMAILFEGAPYALAMADRMRRPLANSLAPSLTFRF